MTRYTFVVAAIVIGTMVAAASYPAGAAMMMNRVNLTTTPLAKTAALEGTTGYADLDVAGGSVKITVTLAAGAKLPMGSVLEGWVVDAGRKGGPGMTHASERDQKFGPAFGDESVAALSRDLPYALSTGLLKADMGSTRKYTGTFKINNSLTPYNAVVVTLESDGNTGGYDPRPGTPVLAGAIGK